MIKKDVGVGGTKVDTVTLQIMTNAIYSVADEMVAALIRTSYSTNIKDRRDCSGAVFTREGEIVAQGEIGTPLHLGVMLPAVQTALQAIPPETLQPDDDIIMNTPYPEGPGHLNDMARSFRVWSRPEEHTSELQSLAYLVCRLLLEKKNQHLFYRHIH